jgi:5-methylcytosine-specific restriction endonuclease McrA
MARYKSIYNTKKWKQVRISIIKRDGYLCQECARKGRTSAGYEVYHKIHLSDNNISDEEIVFGMDNLELVCKDCHFKKHALKDKSSLTNFLDVLL